MKTVVITGASRGIGLAVAQKYAENNFNVILNSLHDNDNLNNALVSCQSRTAGSCISLPGDVSSSDFAHRLINEAASRFGSIDVLINNAGISFVGLIQDTDPEIWNRIISTNLSSVHYCTQAVIPFMLRTHHGSIINISSVWGNTGGACEAAYSASKGGVNAYTKASAKELSPSGISVNAIACGCVKTDMLSCFSEEELASLTEQIPAGRLAEPSEIAEIVYNTSILPSYLTGQIITVDGGWL